MTPATRERLGATFYALVVVFGLVVSAAAYLSGTLFNALFLLLPVLLGAGTVSRLAAARRRRLELGLVRSPFAKAGRRHLLQALNQWMFLLLTALALRFAVVPIQFTLAEHRSVWILIVAQIALLMLFALIPHRKIRISTNLFFAAGWLLLGLELLRIVMPSGAIDAVVLDLPFRGDAYVFQGGRSALINHHYPIRAQRHALDIVRTIDGRDADGDRAVLASHACFGAVLHAPAEGRVVRVVNDRQDMAVGETDREQIVGNHVVLDIGAGRFVLLAHLKQGSVLVAGGDRVAPGQALAACGNSGNSSQPHLHLQVQSDADFQASGLQTFPIVFRDILRRRAGRSERLQEADVRRNDVLGRPP